MVLWLSDTNLWATKLNQNVIFIKNFLKLYKKHFDVFNFFQKFFWFQFFLINKFFACCPISLSTVHFSNFFLCLISFIFGYHNCLIYFSVFLNYSLLIRNKHKKTGQYSAKSTVVC